MDNIVICSSKLARKVVQENNKRRLSGKKVFNLIDIKPHKEDKRRSVFIYEYSDELKTFIDGYVANNN